MFSTVRTAWEAMLTEIQNTSGIHMSVVNLMNEKVAEPLQAFTRDMETQRKQVKSLII